MTPGDLFPPPQPEIVPGVRRAGRVASVLSALDGGFVTTAVESLSIDLEGIPGDRHRGWTRPADSRVPWHPRGTPIRNIRQISIVSVEDLVAIAEAMAVPEIKAEWLGANLVVEEIPHLSFLPKGARLFGPDDLVLMIEEQNGPCRNPGRVIAENYPERDGLELLFPKVARRLRGVLASVERPGRVAAHTAIDIRLPDQWIYR